ncbi:MAG TPA: hypothetical protein VFK06_02555 [Candidatus Angelobacter sp.]|nr:hypothetical protein [Candidatus Angelobacter sp.]
MDAFATAVSLALQYGAPLGVLCRKFSHMRFEPGGWSGNPRIGYASSVMDYIFRWVDIRFLKCESGNLFDPKHERVQPATAPGAHERFAGIVQLGDSPMCPTCGSMMVRSGSCHRCMACGSTSGRG